MTSGMKLLITGTHRSSPVLYQGEKGIQGGYEAHDNNELTAVTPGEAGERLLFYHHVLHTMEELKLQPLPLLTPLQEAPPSPVPGAAADERTPATPASTIPASRDPMNAPRKGRYRHGSPEEQKLQAFLSRAKESGSIERIERARENLGRYWRSIINDEYGSISGPGFMKELRHLGKSHHARPRDPYINYRLHVLAQRAQEQGESAALSILEKIRRGGILRRSSPTGDAIADFAEKYATGNGGQCYAYVADALDRAGIRLSGMSAYMAANQLARHPKVREIRGIRSNGLTSLPKGTIVVWNRGEGHCNGHISISLGNGEEASDMIRTQITDYGTSFRTFVPLDMIDE